MTSVTKRSTMRLDCHHHTFPPSITLTHKDPQLPMPPAANLLKSPSVNVLHDQRRPLDGAVNQDLVDPSHRTNNVSMPALSLFKILPLETSKHVPFIHQQPAIRVHSMGILDRNLPIEHRTSLGKGDGENDSAASPVPKSGLGPAREEHVKAVL